MPSTAPPAEQHQTDSPGLTWQRSRLGRVIARMGAAVMRRPVLMVVGLALLVRVLAAVILASRGGYTIPDEGQYVDLAHYVSDGRGAEAWVPGYGQSLYNTTYPFTALLSDLFRVFGPHRIIGQLIAALFGAATAGAATWLALRIMPRRWAVLAGLVVALLPSQILWSSVVLRESEVWAASAAIAVGVAMAARTRSPIRLVTAAVLCGGGLVSLGFLRQQTAFIAAWALVIAICVFSIARPVLVRFGAVAIAVGMTVAAGIGPMGYSLVHKAAPQLAQERINLGAGAASSFVHPRPIPTATTTSGNAKSAGRAGPAPSGRSNPSIPKRPNGSGRATAAQSGNTSGGSHVITAANGQTYAVDESTTSVALHAFPTGIVAVTVRPYPWEAPTSTTMRFAELEDVGWIVLYLLGLLGVWAGRHRREILAYPVAFAAGILLLGAVTQGNLGTAFRHRGQVLWALAPLSVLGLQWLVEKVRARRSALATT